MKSIKDQKNLNKKKVLLRLDLNVPLKNGSITDETRINKIIPIIDFLIKEQSKIIIISHVGRPKGKVIMDLSLKPICENVEKKIKKKISLIKEDNAQISLFYIFILGTLCTSIALIFFNYLIKITTPVFASYVTYIIPIVAVLWGIVIYEEITSISLLGGLIILIGIFLLIPVIWWGAIKDGLTVSSFFGALIASLMMWVVAGFCMAEFEGLKSLVYLIAIFLVGAIIYGVYDNIKFNMCVENFKERPYTFDKQKFINCDMISETKAYGRSEESVRYEMMQKFSNR